MQMHPFADGVGAQAPVTIKFLSPRAEPKPSLSSSCILKLYLDFSQPAHSSPVSPTPRLWFQLPPDLGNWLHIPQSWISLSQRQMAHPTQLLSASTAMHLSLIWVLFICQANGGVLTLSALWAGLCSLPALEEGETTSCSRNSTQELLKVF